MWIESRNLALVEQLCEAKNPLDVAESCHAPHTTTRKLLAKVRQRKVRMEGIRDRKGTSQEMACYEPIDPDEIPDLYLVFDHLVAANERTGRERIIEIEVPYGLWSRARDTLVWKNMRCSQVDVMNAWPTEGVNSKPPEAGENEHARFPTPESRTKTTRLPPLPVTMLRKFGEELFEQCRASGMPIPNQQSLETATQERFRTTHRVTRERIRELYRQLAPGAKQGPRKKQNPGH
jgi:hypothetical protein